MSSKIVLTFMSYCYGRVLKLFPTEPVTVLPLATKSDVPGVLKELKINSEIGAKAAAAIQGVGVRAESVLGVCWVAEGGGRMGEHGEFAFLQRGKVEDYGVEMEVR